MGSSFKNRSLPAEHRIGGSPGWTGYRFMRPKRVMAQLIVRAVATMVPATAPSQRTPSPMPAQKAQKSSGFGTGCGTTKTAGHFYSIPWLSRLLGL
jgi:hypothetical protein